MRLAQRLARLRGGRLYARLLLWFCVANVATLLVSVFLTERVARLAYRSDPDWALLAQQADDTWLDQGESGLRRWADEQRRKGLEISFFEGERNLTGRRAMPRLPPELRPRAGEPPSATADVPERFNGPGEAGGEGGFGEGGPAPPFAPPLPMDFRGLQGSDTLEFHPRPGVRVVAQRVTGRDGVERQLVVLRRRDPPPPRLEQVLATQIGISLLAIGVVGWWIARSIAQPVAAVQDVARRFAGGELGARVPPRVAAAGGEVGDLARDFDRMAARIEALVTSERAVLQDVSHELRSPLAKLHLLLDLARGAPPDRAAGHFDRAEQQIARLDALIGDALALSRMEADLPGAERAPLELARVLAACVDDWRLEAEAAQVTLGLRECAPATVLGSAVLIARAIDNLIANAIKFSGAGGSVVVGLERDEAHATIVVRDRGPGVPEEELANLFRPFFRGRNGARADGHGLGLAIVQRVITAHRGEVRALNGTDGGLEVRLRLPRAN